MNSTMIETQWIRELEDRMVEITEAKQNEETRMKINEDSLRELCDIKHTNIQITGVT